MQTIMATAHHTPSGAAVKSGVAHPDGDDVVLVEPGAETDRRKPRQHGLSWANEVFENYVKGRWN